MRKNYFLIDVITKAKCFGFTDEEIEFAVKEGIKNYEQMKKQIEKTEKIIKKAKKS
ncbi:MAG: hypothetical protein J6M02_05745 [Clostridia bacterium]|nr:hypothetical protein [Clostridia bacterium]